jgi:hypoxanthine phosphoribosyltransferase
MKNLDYSLAIDSPKIAKRVQEMGEQITADFADRPLLVLGVLKGGFCFLADLVRAINLTYTIDFVGMSSYKQGRESSGRVDITFDIASNFNDQHILVIEDIVDTGITLDYLQGQLKNRGASDISVAVLLDKLARRKVPVELAYRGFEVENRYYVGYGLDYRGYLRNLPYIARLNLA